MAEESERKFLVQSDAWQSQVAEASSIRQFYLVADKDRSLRVRLREGRATLTLKLGAQARTRSEFEYPVSLADAERMEAFAVGNVIEKTRHLVRHRDRLYEVDVFSGALSGLVVAELETTETVPDSELPSWLGREITDMPAYYNGSLALSGLPEAAG